MIAHRPTSSSFLFALCLLSALSGLSAVSPSAFAEDWPCWRGPSHDGISAEKGWLDKWPRKGPPVAWKAAVGTGFSSVAVSKGRAYTMGNADGKDTVWCFDAATGKKVWSHSYPAELGDNLFEGGPTSTPAVHDGRVCTLSRWGDVYCFDAATGKVRWSKNVQKETGAPVPSWGFGGSPLAQDNLLLLNVGSAGMALDRDTGKLVWKSAKEEAGYSTPVPFRRGEARLALFSSGSAFTAVDVRTGKERWQIAWDTRYGVNAADPIVSGDHVFLSSGYGKGAGLFRLGDGAPKEVWKKRTLRTQCNPAVLLGGHCYGIDGDTTGRPVLKCVELKTGAVRWSEEGVGSGSLIAADGKLIVLSDKGELLVARASPKEFRPSARAQVLGGKCWTAPVLANGRIYCRNADGDLVCVDVRKTEN